MSNIFCSQCGSKHTVGAKFCSACGAGLSNFTAPSRNQTQRVEVEDDVSSFKKPRGLAYEIQQDSQTTFKGEELFNAPPVSKSDRIQRPTQPVKEMTQEEYLSESLKECAPRGMRDIDET